MEAQLNSTPEILLRKRRNADRTRLEKQELARKRKALEQRRKQDKKTKFVRAESLVATTRATEREKERMKRVSKFARRQNLQEGITGEYILKITEKAKGDGEEDEELETSDDGLIREKIPYDGKEELVFVIRVKGPVAVKLPHKVYQVLTTLRLLELNTGVFLKLTPRSYCLLKLVAPYVVLGRPSLASIRSLIQKRARIMYQQPGESEVREVVLNDNNIIEEQLGSEGVICVGDVIHEIATMGDAFSKCNFFLLPFRLNREVSGFSAMSRLQKLQQREKQANVRPLSNAATAPLIQVDVDALVEKLN